MEPPNSFDADAVRTEKAKVLEALHPADAPRTRGRNVVRGQYGAGTVARPAGARPTARSRASRPTA